MSDDQDLIRDMTNGADVETRAAGPVICVPGHAINSIEMELLEQMNGEISDIGLPTIFVDSETGELEQRAAFREPWPDYFDGRTPHPSECAEVVIEMTALVEARFAPRIIIARELGPNATRAQYVAACQKEGVQP